MGGLKNRLILRYQNFRLAVAAITKFTSFSINLMKGVYRNYINHDKVIAWRNGYPVFSSFSPPALSKVQANMEARNAISMMTNRKFPNMVSIAINDVCNCDCVHCSLTKKNEKTLTTEELKRAIKDAQALGVATITFVGGEPLLHPDLADILKSVNKDMSVTVMFTNGWFLKEKASMLKKSGLDSINVSVDSADPAIHDRIRGKKGMFDRAIAGIKAAKEVGLTAGLSCCVSKEQMLNGELQRIIELGKRLNVNEIIIFDNMPAGKLRKRKDLKGRQEWTEEIIKISEKYNRRYDYPGIYAYSHIKSHNGLGCAAGVTIFYINPYGDVMPCDFSINSLGNIKKEPLYILWDKMIRKYNCTSINGCRIQNEDSTD